jgi:hypothetical protein
MKVCCPNCNLEIDPEIISMFKLKKDVVVSSANSGGGGCVCVGGGGCCCASVSVNESGSASVSVNDSSSSSSTSSSHECIICCEIVDKLVKCEYCNNTCCNDCFQQHLLLSGIKPKCMHCAANLLFEHIIKMSDSEWYTKVYRLKLQEFFFIEEKKLIPESIDHMHAYLNAQGYARVAQMIKVRVPGRWNMYHGDIEYEYEEQLEELSLSEINANRCLEEYGKGWVRFNFETNQFDDHTTKKLNAYDESIFPCPMSMCLGFVREGYCNICNKHVCSDCREPKSSTHKCNPDTIKSIRVLAKSGRNCPKCYIPISKIDGCDQMFCTECKTTFSWNSGRIYNDNEFHHNPHYLDWIAEQRKNEALIRIMHLRQDDYNCNEYISIKNLLSCFSLEANQKYKQYKNSRKISLVIKPLENEAEYMSEFLKYHKDILHVRATAGNHANVQPLDNNDLRVQLLSNEIDEKKFKELTELKYYDYNKSMLYCNIYMMVYMSAIILFDNLYVFTHSKTKIKQSKLEFLFDTYLQFQKIIEFANSKLDYNKQIFGHDPRFIKFHQ